LTVILLFATAGYLLGVDGGQIGPKTY